MRQGKKERRMERKRVQKERNMYIKDSLSEDLKILFVILVQIECVKTVNSGEIRDRKSTRLNSSH